MKIMDLIIRIINKGVMPKKILYGNMIYEYEESTMDYCNRYDEWLFSETMGDSLNTLDWLNEKVEVVDNKENNQEIEQIEMKYYQDEPANICDLAHKVYELIDEVNKLKEK